MTKLKIDDNTQEIYMADLSYEPHIWVIYNGLYRNTVSEKYYNHTGIILDDDDNEVTRFYHAYESVVLHTIQANALETIRADYDIPSDVFRSWCEQWMKDNKE